MIDQWITGAQQKLKGMPVRRRAFVISVVVALASDLYPLPGFFLGALLFPGGVHSDEPGWFIVTAVVMNFLVFFIACFSILICVWRSTKRTS